MLPVVLRSRPFDTGAVVVGQTEASMVTPVMGLLLLCTRALGPMANGRLLLPWNIKKGRTVVLLWCVFKENYNVKI